MVHQSVLFLIAAAFLEAVVVSENHCTNENLSIIGGHKVTVQDAPYIVALFYQSSSKEYKAFCGGSIIHERFVLTAAHCPYFINLFYGKMHKRVLIGSDRLDAGGMFIDVEKELCYEGFHTISRCIYDDICLLKLKDPVPFGCKVAKVMLPDEDFDLKEGALVNVTGFGDIGIGEGMNNELRQTVIPIVSNDCCNEIYDTINDTQLCAGSRGHDSCRGDSGGPLTYNGIQVGIVSYGELCVYSQAGVYTRVSSYLDWINDIIEQNE